MSSKPLHGLTLAPRTGKRLSLHGMPDRCRVSRFDRLRQKWWTMRARIGLRVTGKL